MDPQARNFLELGLGFVYLIGALFSGLYIYRNGEKFFGSLAEGTWFSPSKWFIPKFVLPNPRLFSISLTLIQLFVAIALLSQGPNIILGLLVGTAFCLYAVFVSNTAGAIINLGLALLQFYLASSR